MGRAAAVAAALFGLATIVIDSTRVAPYRPILRQRRISVPSSWPRLDVLHISDLHVRRRDPRLLESQKQALLRLPRQPDLVCATGDLCEQMADVPLVRDLIACVKPRLGTYLVPGNHEYGVHAPFDRGGELDPVPRLLTSMFKGMLSAGPDEGDKIVAELRALGLNVLRNEGLRVADAGRSVWIAGSDSGWAGRADLDRAQAGRTSSDGSLVLVHEPELAFEAIERGADVVLAGHTHGGQVRLPVLGPPYWHRRDPRLKVAAGLQVIDGATLHISAGMGQVMPIRFNCPTELVWLTCTPPGNA